MSLATYNDLVTSIGDWLKRDDFGAIAADLITIFEAAANRRLRVRQQETLASLTPAADGTVSLPSDYLSWRRLTWTGSPRDDLEYVEPSYLQGVLANTTVQTAVIRPVVFTIETSQVKIAPAGDTTALDFVYFQKVSALSSGSNWLYSAHPDLYLFGSLAEAAAYTDDLNTLAMWKSRRDELFNEIIVLSDRSRGAGNVRPDGPTP